MNIVHANSQNFDALIADGLVLVDFFAVWCGPCKMIAPILEEIATNHNDFKIIKLDVDENQDIAMRYKVMSIPTLIIFKNGHPVSQKLGFMPKELLLKWVDENK